MLFPELPCGSALQPCCSLWKACLTAKPRMRCGAGLTGSMRSVWN